MDIQQCYQILEIAPGASLGELRQAYRDSVRIWHPDRFGESNPRLIKRAEEKIKQINEAYETLVAVYAEQHGYPEGKVRNAAENAARTDCYEENRRGSDNGNGAGSSSMTEVVAEAGTRMVLSASSHLLKIFRRWIDMEEN